METSILLKLIIRNGVIMKKVLIILSILFFISSIFIFEMNFMPIEVINIQNVYIKERSLWDVVELGSKPVYTSVKELHLEAEIRNNSLIKKYEKVTFMVNDEHLSPFIDREFDMGGENGMMSLDAQANIANTNIKILVDKTLSDDEILKAISNKEIVVKGYPKYSVFGGCRVLSKPFKICIEK